MNIKVSVIIPVYNVEKYLGECLDSIFSQTLKEIEVICINDGSTDGSHEILKHYEKNHSTMEVLYIKNQGAGNARNLGIKAAKGKMCCFIDPDDRYPSDEVLECMYNEITEKNVMICGGSAILMKNGEIVRKLEGDNIKFVFSENRILSFHDYQWSYGFWRFMYVRDFLISNNIFFPPYLRYQDPPFFVKAMICAKNFYAMNKATYLYRMSGNYMDLSYEKTRDRLLGIQDVLKMTKDENLDMLYKITIGHINKMSVPLCKHIINGHMDLKQLIIEIGRNIDINLAEIDPDQLPYHLDIEKKLERLDEVKRNEKEFLSIVDGFETIIIYGAGYVGKKVGDYLLNKAEGKKMYYAVTSMDYNEKEYRNIKIISIKEFNDNYKSQALVLLAVMDDLQEEINSTLLQLSYENIHKICFSDFQLYGL
jgi:glycosyltransferase involved in cell wall biosynthesis